MFVGHVALALAGKRARPSVSLGWFVAAVSLCDLIWPVLLISGVEHVRISPGATAFTPFVFESYPWSHSLATVVLWGMLLAALARWRGIAAGTASLLAVLVVSHWVLDVVTHAPDMPLWPGRSPRVGLGLWNSIPATLIVEGAMWVAAIAIYLRSRGPVGMRGAVLFWSWALLCTLMWMSGPFSPPPPDERLMAWVALIGWLMVPWTAWIDRAAPTDPVPEWPDSPPAK